MPDNFDLYEFPAGHTGRRRYVGVRGHLRSIPVIYTYKGYDGYNHILPEYGGDNSGYEASAPMIMRDIDPYKSPIDNTMVTSRSVHRDHMRRHGVVEVGNERLPAPRPNIPLERPGYTIKRTLEQLRGRD